MQVNEITENFTIVDKKPNRVEKSLLTVSTVSKKDYSYGEMARIGGSLQEIDGVLTRVLFYWVSADPENTGTGIRLGSKVVFDVEPLEKPF